MCTGQPVTGYKNSAEDNAYKEEVKMSSQADLARDLEESLGTREREREREEENRQREDDEDSRD